MERARVRVGAQEDLAAGMALPLRDPCRELEHARERGEVRKLAAERCGLRDRDERGDLALGERRQRDRLEVAWNLERDGLIAPVEDVSARAHAPLAVLGGLVVGERSAGVAVGGRKVLHGIESRSRDSLDPAHLSDGE